jgi:hypothetical protein
MRLLSVSQRIDIRIATRQQQTVQSFDDSVDVVRLWNQADEDGRAAGGFDSFAVKARKVKTIGCVFNAHRDADAGPRGVLHVFVVAV